METPFKIYGPFEIEDKQKVYNSDYEKNLE